MSRPRPGDDGADESPAPDEAPKIPRGSLSRAGLRSLAQQLAPEGTRGRDLLRFASLSKRDSRQFTELVRQHWAAWGVTAPGHSYQWWAYSQRARARDLATQRRAADRNGAPVSVHVAVLAGPASDPRALAATLRSLQDQSWHHWRALVATPAGEEALGDRRVVVARPEQRELASMVSSMVAAAADRDLVVVLEAGDRLAPDCLFYVADMAWRNALIDVVYWDDDLLNSVGLGHDPNFRPDWSPEMLLSSNYIGRSFAIRARTLTAIGPLRSDRDDAVWWDVLLRAGLTNDTVERVPRVLTHLTRRPSPTRDASVRTVQDSLERRGERATVTSIHDTVRVAWELDRHPAVSVIIPTRHNRALVKRCLRSLARTAYEPVDVIVIDNGDHTSENQAWYDDEFRGLDLSVEWWDQPFNYSAVNNHAASIATGEVLVFLNDDTEISDPAWLEELVSWATRPDIGLVGLQLLDGSGLIQHGGVILGLNGYADHLFEGMEPNSDTMFGSTNVVRNVLAVTAACAAIRAELFQSLGGFDERFILCGSDVVLGLDATMAGKRNVCLPSNGVRHLEAATRGTEVPGGDFFASYWRYQRWIFGGDPYFSPNLSLESRRPALRARFGAKPHALVAGPLGRPMGVFRQRNETAEASMLADMFRATDADVERLQIAQCADLGAEPPRSLTWFLPDIDSPFYGGVNTALRIADYLTRRHGVENRFAFWADPNDGFFRSALTAAFPSLHDSKIFFYQEVNAETMGAIPDSDAAIATLWATAYAVAHYPGARRRFYLIQDFEPCFYPAGTLYALAEETYRLGLYGLCNTEHMLDLYRGQYGGRGAAFTPAVEESVFHAAGRREPEGDEPVTVFLYARPGHFRNCWEMAAPALTELKQRLGDRVRIVTAGSWAYAEEDELGGGIEHLGLLDYRETGDLYRRCDVGVALTVSQHPSYLPLELMACGVPVVAYDNPAGYWLLKHDENSVLVRRTVDALRDGIERLVVDPELRARLRANGLRTIATHHASWETALAGVYAFLSDPGGGSHASSPRPAVEVLPGAAP